MYCTGINISTQYSRTSVWFSFDLPTLTPTPRRAPSAELPTYPEALTGLDAAELPTYPRAGGLGEELG